MNHHSRRVATAAVALAAISFLSVEAMADGLPKGFVHLRSIDPTILQDIRYATADNFVGRRLPGYNAAECVLVGGAAKALKKVQTDLRRDGYSLKVFDCYRPARAVAAFVAWAKSPANKDTKTRYHPRIAKRKLFPAYIATRSGHSRGTAVDLTIVDLAKQRAMQEQAAALQCRNPKDFAAHQAELDMGTAFDCFDPASQTRASGLTQLQRNNRRHLVKAMSRHGFKNYAGEWWHFTYTGKPSPKTYFDFAIPPLAPTHNDAGGAVKQQ